jgi:hypothetical protein
MHFTMMDCFDNSKVLYPYRCLRWKGDGEYAAVTSGAFATADGSVRSVVLR